MKKTAALIMASALMICSFASCASSAKDIVGKWEMSDISDTDIKVGGLEFKDNGKGSMYMDTTGILHADGKALIIGSGESAVQFDEDLIKYDGNTLDLTFQGQNFLTLERTGSGGSEDNYDGQYIMKSGVMYDTITNSITKDKEGSSGEAVNVNITFDGDKSEVIFVDIFNYKAEKGTLELSGYASFIGDLSGENVVKAEFEVKDDTLTVTSSNGEKESLIRAK